MIPNVERNNAVRRHGNRTASVMKTGAGDYLLTIYDESPGLHTAWRPGGCFKTPSEAMKKGNEELGLVAAKKAGGKRRHGRDLGPPWRMHGERILGEVTVGGAVHRRVTPRVYLPEGKLPAHMIPPTKTLAEMNVERERKLRQVELDTQAEAVRKLLRK